MGAVLVHGVAAAHTAALVTRLAVAWAGATAQRAPGGCAVADPPRYTVIGPLRDEAGRVESWLRAAEALRYPPGRKEILIVVEDDDERTREAAERAVAARGSPAGVQIVVVPAGVPRTKPRALAYALERASGELVVVYDAEDVPDPDQLLRAAARFAAAGPGVGCLQARLEIRPASACARDRLMAAEYRLWHGAVLPGLARLSAPVPLGGTSNHLRVEALRRVGGWDPRNVAEDADLGLRLARAGLRTETLPSVTTEDGTPPGTWAWMRQRARWSAGFAQTWWAALAARPRGGVRVGLTTHGIVAGSLVLQLTTPVLALAGVIGTRRSRSIAGTTIAVSLLARTAALAGASHGRPGTARWAPAGPAYLVLEGAAAWRGMWDLARRRGHWHLTAHPPVTRAGG